MTVMMTETQTIYRPVPGYVDLYAGMDASIVLAGVGELEQKTYRGKTYLQVIIPGRGTTFVHSLMAAAYLGPRQEDEVVRHGENGMFDNRPGNLCYGTTLDNTHDAIKAGTHASLLHKNKTRCNNGHEFTDENTYTPPGTNWRQCRKCRRTNDIARQNRKALGIQSDQVKLQIANTKSRGLIAAHKEALDEYVMFLLSANPPLKNRVIARRTGISHTTINRFRRKLE